MGSSVLDRLEAFSDHLSPIVVKEVRQFVRSREFLASFATSLMIALVIAFFGSTQAVTGSRTAGATTFTILTACLALLGLAVVPLGAFTTLRTERLEQTLDLISLTTMSPRRIVVGKLGAQCVKLVTFFAVMTPFVATSFLLGGIDFVTILTAMVAVFLASMWAAAAALFVSTMFQSRLMSGLALGVMGIGLFVVSVAGRAVFLTFRFGVPLLGGPSSPYATTSQWPQLVTALVFCLMTMTNLVLLAESRLTLPTENRVSALRLGLLAQFLLLVAWTVGSRWLPGYVRSSSLESFLLLGGLHLALVAAFAVTEGVGVPNPRVAAPRWLRRWPWLQPVLGPGGGRAAVYMLLQMVAFVLTGTAVGATASEVRLMIAMCGSICLLSGLPTLLVHRFSERGLGPLHARGITLMLLMLSLVVPDVVYYVIWRPDAIPLSFGARHLFSPVLPLFSWGTVSGNGWEWAPILWAVLGLISYLGIMAASRAARERLEPAVMLVVPTGDPSDRDPR